MLFFIKRITPLIILFFIYSSSYAAKSEARAWLLNNLQFDLSKISENISPSDGLPGAIIAAKTRSNPNYYYHWVRDAGITIESLLKTYPMLSQSQKNILTKEFADYLSFSSKIQNTYTLSDLGEPKFNVDGSPFNDKWGRPQNDSPAMRAISLIDWANILISEGKISFVKANMYKSQMPALSPIKMDLEYVSHHWSDPSYDLWEEVKGTHFYTLMIERRALIEGADLANKLGDASAAVWYSQQAKEIEHVLQRFWDPEKGYIVETLDIVEGYTYKSSNLDVAVILGLIQGGMDDGFLDWDDPRVLATMKKTIDVFSDLYPINRDVKIPGIAIGRYPEDKYNGANFNGGNPWPLCTLAIAEGLYRYAHVLMIKNQPKKAEQVIAMADQFIERVHYHAYKDGSLSEQMDKNTGFMTSAEDLTWNYAAMLSARDAASKFN